jgi:hypothetical protein
MRLLIAGLVMALMVASAQAQMSPQGSQMQNAAGIGQHASEAGAKADAAGEQKVKANDKAYNAVLKNLPDKQYDPWHGVR